MKNLILVSTVGCALAIAVACSDSDTNTNPASGANMDTTTMSVGQSGGTVSAGDASVEIPADALSSAEDITVAEADVDVDPPSGLALAGPAIAFTPHGMSFDEPVTLTLPYSSSASDLVVIKLEDDKDTSWEEVDGAEFSRGSATLDVTSFSIYAVAEPDSANGGTGGADATGGASMGGADAAGGASEGGATAAGGTGEGGMTATAGAGGATSGGTATLDEICQTSCEVSLALACPEEPATEAACLDKCMTDSEMVPESCYDLAATYVQCTKDKDFLICGTDGTISFPDNWGDPNDPNDCGAAFQPYVGCIMNGGPLSGETAADGTVYGSCLSEEQFGTICADYTGSMFEGYPFEKTVCGDDTQTLSMEPCDTAGAFAVCHTDPGGPGEQDTYYFGDATVESITPHCEQALMGTIEEL